MAKFAGYVGYATPAEEVSPGVWENDNVTERFHKGDLLRYAKSQQESTEIHSDLTLQNRISIVADEYAYENFQNIRYVLMNNTPWVVTNIEVTRPRLIVSLGGVWNGPRPTVEP